MLSKFEFKDVGLISSASDLSFYTSKQWQMARLLWFKKRDANLKFFDVVM